MADIGSVKGVIQVQLLKEKMDIQKKTVIDLYKSLEKPIQVSSDSFTRTGAASAKGTYKP